MRKFPNKNNVCITNEKNFSKKKTFTSPMRKFPDKNKACITNEAAESSGRRKMKSSNSQWCRLDIIITIIKYVINRNDINNHRSLPHYYVTNRKGWLYPFLPVACRPREARVWRAIQEPKRWITIIWRKINTWSNPSHHRPHRYYHHWHLDKSIREKSPGKDSKGPSKYWSAEGPKADVVVRIVVLELSTIFHFSGVIFMSIMHIAIIFMSQAQICKSQFKKKWKWK